MRHPWGISKNSDAIHLLSTSSRPPPHQNIIPRNTYFQPDNRELKNRLTCSPPNPLLFPPFPPNHRLK